MTLLLIQGEYQPYLNNKAPLLIYNSLVYDKLLM